MAAWLLLQSSYRLALQDGGGFVLLQGDATATAGAVVAVPAVTRSFSAPAVTRAFAVPAVTRTFTAADPEA